MKKQKRFLSVLIGIVMLLSITMGLDYSSYALEPTGQCGNNAYYSFDAETGTLTITGTGSTYSWNNTSGETHFTNNPFYKQYDIKSVVIENGITQIGSYAFYVCKYITSVIIPDSVTSIDDYAFYGCTTLKDINIPDSLTNIGVAAFRDCMNLLNVTIPNGVTSISTYAFYNCIRLQSITISNNVISIGYCAFEECESLTSLVIPDSVKNIDFSAFNGCISLINLSMPVSTMVYNGVYESLRAFRDCTNVTDLTVTAGDGDVINYTDSGPGGTDIYYQYSPWYISRDKLTSITVADGVNGIGNMMFFGNNIIEQIEFPESVSYFGSNIFDKSNSNLKTVKVYNPSSDIGLENLVKAMPTGSTLYAYESTGIKAFCENSGIYFVSLDNADCEHIAGEVMCENIVEPTCTQSGSCDEVVRCSLCSAELSREKKTIDATGHMYVYKGNDYDALVYSCYVCNQSRYEYADELFEFLILDLEVVYNERVTTTKYNDSSLYDVVTDGVINAKDYAYLMRMTK